MCNFVMHMQALVAQQAGGIPGQSVSLEENKGVDPCVLPLWSQQAISLRLHGAAIQVEIPANAGGVRAGMAYP